jgi:hypothetical protein
MKIAIFNINNVKRRLPSLLELLKAASGALDCCGDKTAGHDADAG